MKFSLSIIIICFSYHSSLFSQTYSKEISDYEISVFFKQLRNSAGLKIKKIDERILEWTNFDMYGYTDSSIGIFSDFGIIKNEIIQKHLSKNDMEYIEKQYLGIKDSIWSVNEFKKIKLLDSNGLKHIHDYSMKRPKRIKGNYSYSFSVPLFSIKKDYVILIQNYYCGFMCSTQCYYLYQRKILTNKWKEIAHWYCLSS